MYYIRTEKNNYNIDIVIDVTDNEHFVQTSGLSWIETDVDISPQIGDYYYNNKFINLQSEDYKIIENIIFEYEEIKRIEREAEEERIRLEIERQMHENPIEPAPPELTIDAPLIDPRTLPKPVPGPLIGIEITMQNYEHWSNANANTNVLINALETKNPVVEDRIVKFDPPIEFPDGVIQSEFAFPDDSLGEYIDYLKQTDFYQKELLTRMKAYLGIV